MRIGKACRLLVRECRGRCVQKNYLEDRSISVKRTRHFLEHDATYIALSSGSPQNVRYSSETISISPEASAIPLLKSLP